MLISGTKLMVANIFALGKIRAHVRTPLDQSRKYEALALSKSSVYWQLRILYRVHVRTYFHSHSRIGSIWRIRKRPTGDYRFQIDPKLFIATTKATHGKNTCCVHFLGSPFVPSSFLSSSCGLFGTLPLLYFSLLHVFIPMHGSCLPPRLWLGFTKFI